MFLVESEAALTRMLMEEMKAVLDAGAGSTCAMSLAAK
jgi:hypothetical protein